MPRFSPGMTLRLSPMWERAARTRVVIHCFRSALTGKSEFVFDCVCGIGGHSVWCLTPEVRMAVLDIKLFLEVYFN